MKKSHLLTLLALVCMPELHAQGWGGFGMMQAPRREKKIYSLSAGNVKMDIDANCGGRIVSLKLDTTEIISQIETPNQFGSTFWTSPQKEWNWPPVREHDTNPYTVEQQDGAIIMTSELSQRFPIRIKKTFKADEAGKCFNVTYTMTNEGDSERKVAPWEITRVLSQGSIFFDADVDQITPAGLMPFEKKNGFAWFDIDHQGQNRKINSDGKGWLAYTDKGLLLVKRFQDLDKSQPAPDEAEIQVYVHQGNVYVELESQGAYTTLAPGQSMDWTVRWYLVKADKDVAKQVKKIIGK